MHVGILTVPLRNKPLQTVIPWAAAQGIKALEIDVNPGSHLEAISADEAKIEELKALLQQHGMRISSLAGYGLLTGAPLEVSAKNRATLEAAVRLAAKLGVDTVCALAGFPLEGKSKDKTIAEDLPAAFRPILDRAAEHGVRIALENWYKTNIQHLEHWRMVFEALPDKHFGLNFDPSHLDWQGIDVTAAVLEFAPRIFHVHAKDVWINETLRLRVGWNGEGWWRYVLPGYGRIRWGEFITTLRQVGYDGVLSIEHEDKAFGPEEGFSKSARYLNSLV